MKLLATSKQLFAKTLFFLLLGIFFVSTVSAQAPTGLTCQAPGGGPAQCCDGIDNDIGVPVDYGLGKGAGDGRADYYGSGALPADPKCLYYSDTEAETNPSTSEIIPCTDKCTLESVFQLANNIISFFFRILLIPFFIVILLFMGYKYFTAQGNPGVHKQLKSMLWHIIAGLVLILTAWLIVNTILSTVIDPESETGKGALQFFK